MNEQTVRIRDLGLAAALVSCAFEMRGTTRDGSGQAYFMFTQTNELDQTVNKYWADTLQVRARHYSDGLKMLKSRLYSER